MQHFKITSLVFSLILVLFCNAQNVGIGTTTPSTNAILDVASSSKGIMLPRLTDTSVITTPTAGLLIYNRNTNSPNYYDGTRWQNFTPSANTVAQDSITYTISNSSGGMVVGTFDAVQMNHTGSSPSGGAPTMNAITLSKYYDANTVPFKKILAVQATNPTIEIKVYTPGTGTLYYSVKLTNWHVTQEDFSVSSLNGKMLENYTLTGPIIGFKDWINNQSFGWNSVSVSAVAY